MWFLLTAAAASVLPVTRFDDVTLDVGLPNVRRFSSVGLAGAAVAWVDWDADGAVDLVVGGGVAEPTRVWLNRDGGRRFEPIEPASLATTTDVIAIDRLVVDGAEALALATADRGQLVVVPVGAAGVEARVPVASPGVLLQSLTHGDLDGDGVHELVVTAAACGAGRSNPRTIYTLKQGPRGLRWWVDGPGGGGCWAVAMVTDYFDEGRPALMVVPDFGPVDGAGYVLGADRAAVLPAVYGMGVAAADTDGDGAVDYAFSSVGPDVLLAGGRLAITDAEWADTGVRFKWGLAYGDFDNDGDMSLWAAAGPVDYPIQPLRAGGLQRDVFIDDGVDRSAEVGVDDEGDQRAVALADFDRDGRLDGVVTGPDTLTLYRNVTVDPGHFVALEVPDAPGARFEVTACGVTQVREWSGGTAGVAHERLIHVGLGACTEGAVVKARWPWGDATTHEAANDARTVLALPGGSDPPRAPPSNEVLTSPHPAWAGEPFALLAPEGTVPGAGVQEVGGRYVASGESAVFETPSGSVSVPLVASFAAEQELTVDAAGASFIPVDALGRPRAEMTANWVIEGATGTVDGGIGWVFSAVDGAPERYTLRRSAPDAVVEVEAGPPGPVDVEKSRLWVTQPYPRAGVGDVVTVALILRDAQGRVIAPGAGELPSAPGWSVLSAGWEPVGEFLGLPVSGVAMRVGDALGPVEITAGGLTSLAVVFPPAARAVDLGETEVTGEDPVTVWPRDPAGQLVGPGADVPGGVYGGGGRYVIDGSPAEVRIAGASWRLAADGQWALVVPAPDEGCAVGVRGRPLRGALGLALLGFLVVVRRWAC